jgi:hypothetical protein
MLFCYFLKKVLNKADERVIYLKNAEHPGPFYWMHGKKIPASEML